GVSRPRWVARQAPERLHVDFLIRAVHDEEGPAPTATATERQHCHTSDFAHSRDRAQAADQRIVEADGLRGPAIVPGLARRERNVEYQRAPGAEPGVHL